MEPELITTDRLYRFTRAEYERMIAAGLLDENDRVELVHGMLVRKMSPIGARHVAAVNRLTHLLVKALDGRCTVQVQSPFPTDDHGEPEPDLALVPLGDFDRALPTSAHLIIEVADTTLAFDRQVKGPMYARAQVPEYWVVNLKDRQIEVYTGPVLAEGRYAHTATVDAEGSVRLVAFPDVVVLVADVLPA